MKILFKLLVLVSVSLFLTSSTMAQSSDVLRDKIEQFEKTDIASKSAAVQSIYQRTLLRLYTDYNTVLSQEIAEVKNIQTAQSGTTDPQLQRDTAALLLKLQREQSMTIEKIKTLGRDVGATVAQQPSVPAQPSKLFSDSGGPRLSDPSTEVPRILKGTAIAINEQIFTNSEKFTPEQIRQAVQKVIARRQGITLQVDDDVPDIEVEGTNQVIKAHSTPRTPPPPPQGNLILKKDHVGALNTPLTEVKIKVEGTGLTTPLEFLTDYQGNFTTSALGAGTYVFSVTVGTFKTSIPVNITAGVATPPPNLQLLVRPLGEFSRAIVGFEQAGASAAKADQKWFFDLTLSHPLPFQKSVDPYFGPRGRMWGTVRVTSVPQQISSTVGQFSTGFAQQVSEIKVNEVAQATEFLAGIDYRITNKFMAFGSFGGQTATKVTLSFIAGGGAITPFTPRETLEVFKAFPGAPGLPTLPAGTEFVAFVSPDRDRFFRQYYAGLRLQTHYFDYKNRDIPINRYPAQLDLTFGQNESITGGRLHGGVLRIEGFYPLPYDELKFINLFGTALIRPVRTRITDPLILQLAPADTVVPAANVFLITVPQINRDYYRIGVGIDFIELVKKLGAGVSR